MLLVVKCESDIAMQLTLPNMKFSFAHTGLSVLDITAVRFFSVSMSLPVVRSVIDNVQYGSLYPFISAGLSPCPVRIPTFNIGLSGLMSINFSDRISFFTSLGRCKDTSAWVRFENLALRTSAAAAATRLLF